jgi:hypothetical protein
VTPRRLQDVTADRRAALEAVVEYARQQREALGRVMEDNRLASKGPQKLTTDGHRPLPGGKQRSASTSTTPCSR